MKVQVDTSQTIIGSEYPGLPGYRLTSHDRFHSRYDKYDPQTRIKSVLYFDHVAKTVHTYKEQDVEDIIEANKRAQNDFSGYSSIYRASQVPLLMDQKLKELSGLNPRTGEYDEKKYKSFLNDADYKYLKTVPGRV
jgi:hypothetical protein